MKKFHHAIGVVLGLVGATTTAIANNDLSTSYRPGSISAPSVDSSSTNATTVGVNQGRATYSIPIQGPPGGVEPSLALVYTGERRESVVGTGWELSYPSIRVRTSGRGGQPEWGVSVRYLAPGGEELIELAAVAPDQDGDGTAESIYREERDVGFVRYLQLSAGGWEMQRPDGRKLTLGTSSATRIERSGFPGQIAEWLPESLVDTSGNELRWIWADASTVATGIGATAVNEVARYLVELRWGCQDCLTAASYQSITINHAMLPIALLDFSPGFLIETELYVTSLSTATTIAGSRTPVRTYTLSYDGADTRRLLTGVTTTGADGSALPPLVLGYTDRDAPTTASVLASPPGGTFSSGVEPIDVDIDGRPDIVNLSNTAASADYYRNQGAAGAAFAAAPTSIPFGSRPGASLGTTTGVSGFVSSEDTNLDLKIDVLDLSTGKLYAHDGGAGWDHTGVDAVLPPNAASQETIRIDVDSDGFVDLIDTSVSPWVISFDDGSRTYTADQVVLTAATTPTFGAALFASKPGVVFGDVNGDGPVDVVYVENGTTARVYYGRGRLGFGWLAEDNHATTQYSTFAITTTVAGTAGPTLARTSLGDLDGDGLADLLTFDSVRGQVRLWRRIPGAGFSDAGTGSPFTQVISNNAGCRVADFDMDGLREVLCSSGWNVYDLANQTPFLLASIDNGQGLITRVSFTTTAREAAAAEAADDAWTSNVSMALPIVAATETDDRRGNVVVTTYKYRDPHYENDELEYRAEFVGFRYIETDQAVYLESTPGDPGTRAQDPHDPGAVVRTFFDVGADDYYQRGMRDCEESWPRGTAPADFTCDLTAQGPLVRSTDEHSSHTDADGITTVQVDAEDRYVLEGGAVASGARIRTEYSYDAFGNRIEERYFGRYSGSVDATGADERMVKTDYVRNIADWIVRLPRLTVSGVMDTSGAIPTLVPMAMSCTEYDDVGALCDPGYHGTSDGSVTRGLMTRALRYADPDLTDGSPGTMQMVSEATYTDEGLPDVVTDGAGFMTAYGYDPVFRLFRTSETLDPGGVNLTTTFVVSSKHGQVTRVDHPDGTFSRGGYDDLGRFTQLVRMGDSFASPTLSRSYALASPVSTITDVNKDGTANGLATTSTVDGAGRLLCQRKEGLAGKQDIEVQREYSGRGLAVMSYMPRQATGCAVTRAGRTSPLAHDVVAYDPLSRPTTRTHRPSGSSTLTAYGVLAITESDEEDTDPGSPHHATPTVRVSDGLGRVVTVTEYVDADGDDAVESYTMTHGYDALGNLTSVVDLLGTLIFEAHYDSRGHAVWIRDPDQGIERSEYDAMGRQVTHRNARGGVVSRTYDGAGRPLTVAADDGVAVETTVYHYDQHPAGGAMGQTCHVAGRLGWVEDPSGQTVNCYDDKGRISQQDTTIDAYSPTPFVTGFNFDGLGRPKTVTHPDGTRLTYGYDASGRASTLLVKGTGAATYALVTSAKYDATGRPTQIDYGNGASIRTEYDDRGRAVRHRALLAGTQLDLTLALDHVGNVESITDGVPGGKRSAAFVHDDWDRLIEASGDFAGGEVFSYAYDLRGNMLSHRSSDPTSPLHVDRFHYDDPGSANRLTGIDRDGDAVIDESFAYDASGNLDTDGVLDFDFDAMGRLREVKELSGSTVVTHDYDHLGQRVASTYAGGDAVYFVRPANAELRDIGATTVLRKHVTFAGRTIGVVDGTFTGANKTAHIFLYAHDHLGAHPLVFDVGSPAAVVERWAGYPFGAENVDVLAAEGHLADYRDPADAATRLSHRFQGREIDPVVPTLYDFGARVYRSDLGRFMSPDSVVPEPGASQSWNRYAFVRNNPLRYVDPTGHDETPAVEEEVIWDRERESNRLGTPETREMDVGPQQWDWHQDEPNQQAYRDSLHERGIWETAGLFTVKASVSAGPKAGSISLGVAADSAGNVSFSGSEKISSLSLSGLSLKSFKPTVSGKIGLWTLSAAYGEFAAEAFGIKATLTPEGFSIDPSGIKVSVPLGPFGKIEAARNGGVTWTLESEAVVMKNFMKDPITNKGGIGVKGSLSVTANVWELGDAMGY